MDVLERIERAEEEIRLAKIWLSSNDRHADIKKVIAHLPHDYTVTECTKDYGGEVLYFIKMETEDNFYLYDFFKDSVPKYGYMVYSIECNIEDKSEIVLRKL